jgi:hypothetical protein
MSNTEENVKMQIQKENAASTLSDMEDKRDIS